MATKEYCYKYPRPAFTVDAAIYDNSTHSVLLIKRKNEPFKNMWALPGGFMDIDEIPLNAAIRELKEETGIVFQSLKQFRTYGAIDRDPRHRTISTVFYGDIENAIVDKIQAGDDAKEAKWHSINELPELAFDHLKIINEWMLSTKM
jgi:8-oxo-dGTP diphosphatase